MKRFALLASLVFMWVLMLNGCGKTDKEVISDPPGGAHVTTGSIRVTNSFSVNLVDLYISPTSDNEWGSDQLSNAIQPGGAVTITAIPPDSYDVKGVMADGTKFVVTDVTVTVGSIVTIDSPTTGSIRLTNNTSNSILYLYITPISSSSWGADQLGSNILQAGATVTISSIPAGRYKVKAVTSIGTELYANDVEVIGGLINLLQATSSKIDPTETQSEKLGTEGAITYIPPTQ